VYTGLSGATTEQQLLRANGHLQAHSMRARSTQKSGTPILAHRTLNSTCPVCTGHPGGPRSQKLQRSESNGIGDVAGAPDMSGVHYRCPNGPPGTDPARTRFGPVRIGSGQARPVDASGRVGLAHVPRDMPKPGTHRKKSCRAGPLARWASTDRAGHWPEPTVERYINTYI
jgi:hypothetical protein